MKKVLKWIGIACGVFLALVFIIGGTAKDKKPEPQQAATSAPVAAPQPAQAKPDPSIAKAKFEECKTKLTKSQKIGMLHNIDVKGMIVKVTVGPTFYDVPFDTKQEFAKTINCYLMEGADYYISFDMRDYRTNKIVAEFDMGKLEMKK